MNVLLRERLTGIQQVLMGHHRGGRDLPNAVIGNEREYILNGFLAKVLPSVFRFGRGVITDSHGQITGQMDTIMELPFSPNYSMPSGEERLYLAESVCAVIEIKSDLSGQWAQVERTVETVKPLRRHL